MQEAVRTYLELALGLTDTSRKKVRKAVKDAVGKGGATAEQIKALTSDLVAANSANREAISKLVRFEVDRALGVVGLATAEEVSDLTARVRDLEAQLERARRGAGDGAAEPGADSTGRVGADRADDDHAVPKQVATEQDRGKAGAAKKTMPAAAADGKRTAAPAKASSARPMRKTVAQTSDTRTAKAREETAGRRSPARKTGPRKAQP